MLALENVSFPENLITGYFGSITENALKKFQAKHGLQEFLAYEGSYTEALISGYFGNLTRNAVMKFQKKYSITPVSGYVGYKTRHRMQQLTGF